MSKVLKLKITVTGLLLVALLAVAVSTAVAPATYADTFGCAYTGHAYLSSDDSNPVPDDTAIRAM